MQWDGMLTLCKNEPRGRHGTALHLPSPKSLELVTKHQVKCLSCLNFISLLPFLPLAYLHLLFYIISIYGIHPLMASHCVQMCSLKLVKKNQLNISSIEELI